jgi:hypothetical protein
MSICGFAAWPTANAFVDARVAPVDARLDAGCKKAAG